jgi:hypothetical protein
VSKLNGSFYFSNVNIIQGEVVTRQFEMEEQNISRRFIIPSANVDIRNLTITVQESRTNTFTTPYSTYNDITEITGNTAAYFVEEDGVSNYIIYFGDGVIGKKPKNGSIINITYIDTVGGAANSINNFSFTDSVGGKYSSNVRVISTSPTFSGSDKETVEQIRFRAPYYYTTQNRAVTKNDYETLIIKDYPNIESVSVWGGQDNNPTIYGKVFISLKPKENYFLTEQEKEDIKERLIVSRNILTVIPEIVDPDFTYLLIRGTVFYNPNLTELTAEQLKQNVRAAISDYRNSDLLTFDSTFKKSKLQTTIENSEKSIVGSNLKIFLQKRCLNVIYSVYKKY